jgi:hypothetical protein
MKKRVINFSLVAFFPNAKVGPGSSDLIIDLMIINWDS